MNEFQKHLATKERNSIINLYFQQEVHFGARKIGRVKKGTRELAGAVRVSCACLSGGTPGFIALPGIISHHGAMYLSGGFSQQGDISATRFDRSSSY